MNNNKETIQAQACAACKYQRRRCVPDCPLAPYFPAHRQREFLNAHRLFGVSNILKMLNSAEPEERSNLITSIVYEANAHAKDPAGGCHRELLMLQQQRQMKQAELDLIKQRLAFLEQPVLVINDKRQSSFVEGKGLYPGGGGGVGGRTDYETLVYKDFEPLPLLGESTMSFDGQLPFVGGSDQSVFFAGPSNCDQYCSDKVAVEVVRRIQDQQRASVVKDFVAPSSLASS